MKSLKLTKRSRLRLLIYGKPGQGKTTLAGTATLDDRTAPVLWLDCGGNPIVLSRLKNPRVSLLQIDQPSDMAVVYKWIKGGQQPNAMLAVEHELTPPYKTIVFDGITGIQWQNFNIAQGITDLAPGEYVPPPEWGHYRSVLAQMVMIAAKFYTLPMHIIFTALEHPEQRFIVPGESKTQYIYREPALAGQSVDQFPGWALNVGRLALVSTYDPKTQKEAGAADKDYNILQFKPTLYVDAKDQHGFGPYHVNPTIRKLLDIMDAQEAPAINNAGNGGTPA